MIIYEYIILNTEPCKLKYFKLFILFMILFSGSVSQSVGRSAIRSVVRSVTGQSFRWPLHTVNWHYNPPPPPPPLCHHSCLTPPSPRPEYMYAAYYCFISFIMLLIIDLEAKHGRIECNRNLTTLTWASCF